MMEAGMILLFSIVLVNLAVSLLNTTKMEKLEKRIKDLED